MDLFWGLLLLSKKKTTLQRVVPNFVYFLDDELKVNFLVSFNSIMKTKTKFTINQIIT